MTRAMKSMKVLAVDDNRTNLHILQVFLKKLGHEVVLAENGEEAVKRFEADQPDLILLDIMMPVMDGFEAARRIKAMNRERWTPIIFLSALNRDENLVEGLDAGADDYLTKPINFIVLEAKLRSMQRSLAMQQASIDSLRRVQTISDNVLDAIVTTDDHGAIVSTNLSAERIFGWAANDMAGRQVAMLLPADSPIGEGSIFGLRENDSCGALGQEREIEALRRDGRRFHATVSLSQVVLDGQRMHIAVIRDISERKAAEQKLQENAEQLQAYYEHTQSEQQLAMRLMEKQLHRSGLKDSCLHYSVIPAENFSGDIVAAARSPEGRFYALLADATGHGLTAAISVLPVLALFYRMTKLNRSVREIILELNQQLRESMPIGRFVAATLVCLDEVVHRGEIWVGGTPETFLVNEDGSVARTFVSNYLPLGILDNKELDAAPETFFWLNNSQLILCSDGLLEAENSAGQQFSVAGLIGAAGASSPTDRFEKIQEALTTHLGDNLASDDVSLMIIDCP